MRGESVGVGVVVVGTVVGSDIWKGWGCVGW